MVLSLVKVFIIYLLFVERLIDKNFLFLRRRIRESGLYVKLDFHTPYCVWRLGAEFLDETGVKAEVFWRGI